MQAPATHALPTGQTLPHAPQLLTLFDESISQPSAGRALQSLNPPEQRTPHAPPAQTAEALGAPAQTFPHRPQFAGSLPTLTQALPHFVDPPWQTTPQAPAEQPWPAGQMLPHAPQF